MQVQYSKQAVKYLMKIQPAHAKNIREKVNQYAENPESLQNMVKKLEGREGYRLRVGNYRVIFDKYGNVLYIEEIGPRGGIYK